MPRVDRQTWNKILATVSPRAAVEAKRRREKKFIQPRTVIDGDVLRIEIPLETHNRKSEHWLPYKVARENKGIRILVGGYLLTVRQIAPPLPVRVLLRRLGPRELDDDNLRFALSAVRDEVAAFYGVVDADPQIRFDYAQTSKQAYGTHIEIMEA